jgi:hypothetical protein
LTPCPISVDERNVGNKRWKKGKKEERKENGKKERARSVLDGFSRTAD